MDDEQVTTDLRKVWEQLESIDLPGVHMLGLHDTMDLNATIRNPDKTLGLHFQLTQEVTFTPSERHSGLAIRLSRPTLRHSVYGLCQCIPTVDRTRYAQPVSRGGA